MSPIGRHSQKYLPKGFKPQAGRRKTQEPIMEEIKSGNLSKRTNAAVSNSDHLGDNTNIGQMTLHQRNENEEQLFNSKKRIKIIEGKSIETNTIVGTDNNLIQKYTIPVKNKFEALSDTSKNDTSGSIQSEEKIRIPPIYLIEVNKYSAIVSDLNKMASNSFTAKQLKEKIKIQLTSTDDYRKITKYYAESNIQFYSFVNPIDSKLSVVMKPIPYSLTNEEIKKELLALNYPVHKVQRLENKDRQPTPLCSVVLENNQLGKSIFNLNKFYHCMITVEPRRKSNNIPQCRNCLKWNHTKNYCHLSPKCVLCAGSHVLKDCPLRNSPSTSTKTITPKCSNCGGPHPASYRGCEEHKRLKTIAAERRMKTGNHKEVYITAQQPMSNAWNIPLNLNKDNETDAPPATSKLTINPQTQVPNLEQLTLSIMDIVKKTIENLIPSIIQQVLECFLNRPSNKLP